MLYLLSHCLIYMTSILAIGFAVRLLVVLYAYRKLYCYMEARERFCYLILSDVIGRAGTWSSMYGQILQAHKWTFAAFYGQILQAHKWTFAAFYGEEIERLEALESHL